MLELVELSGRAACSARRSRGASGNGSISRWAMESGASGFLLRDAPAHELAIAIRRAVPANGNRGEAVRPAEEPGWL